MNQLRQFDLELADLRRALSGMGDLVVRSVTLAVDSMLAPTVDARVRVRVYEDQLDTMDSEIEDRCHRIMALQSPLAGDLRLLVSATRVTMDLENIGDLAESMAKRASALAKAPRIVSPTVLEPLGRLAIDMLRRSVAVFVDGDVVGGSRLVADEKESDRMTKIGYGEIQQAMIKDPEHIPSYLLQHRSLGHLEQMCDLALSIAEEAVYAHHGKMARHQKNILEQEL